MNTLIVPDQHSKPCRLDLIGDSHPTDFKPGEEFFSTKLKQQLWNVNKRATYIIGEGESKTKSINIKIDEPIPEPITEPITESDTHNWQIDYNMNNKNISESHHIEICIARTFYTILEKSNKKSNNTFYCIKITSNNISTNYAEIDTWFWDITKTEDGSDIVKNEPISNIQFNFILNYTNRTLEITATIQYTNDENQTYSVKWNNINTTINDPSKEKYYISAKLSGDVNESITFFNIID